jgi:hypothetical protein
MLNEEEIRVIRMLIESRLSALAVEIRHTDHREFRELLREQRATCEGVLAKLTATTAEPDLTQATGYRRA